jgi:microcystin-dependent protein
LAAGGHSSQHSNANDAIEAIEAKIGVDSSPVQTSIDWLIKNHAHDGLTSVSIITASVGDIKWSIRTVAESGWLLLGGGTIGDASSGGTIRANADTLPLFTLLWSNYADAELPIYTSAGGASTRGASAAVDFAAHKRLSLPDPRGSGLVPYKSGDADFGTLGKKGGAKTHALAVAELPAHHHSVDPPNTTSGTQSANHTHSGTTGNPSSNHTHTFSTSSVGDHTPVLGRTTVT